MEQLNNVDPPVEQNTDPLGILKNPATTPSADKDPLGILKKKEDPVVVSSESGTTPVGSDDSSKQQAPVTEPSKKSTAKEKYDQRLQNLRTNYQNQFESGISKYASEEQKSYDSLIGKKRDEIKSQVDSGSLSAEEANKQLQEYSTQVAGESNQRLKDYQTKYANDLAAERGPDLDKWAKLYSDDYQREDFQENKVRSPISSLGKSMWNTLRYQIPSDLISGQMAMEKFPEEVTKKGFDVLPDAVQKFLKGEIHVDSPLSKAGDAVASWIQKAGDDYAKDLPKKEYEKAASPQEERRKNMFRMAMGLKLDGSENSKYLVNSLDKAEDFIDYMNWAGSALGQAGAQIPAAIATRGGTAIGQEIGSIYMDGINRIAEEKGITPREVIDQGLDEAIFPVIFGTAAGALETIGAKGVGKGLVDNFGKKEIMSSLRDRGMALAKAGVIESTTEGGQSVLEQIGGSKASGKTFLEALKGVKADDIIESMAQGAIGGTGLHAVGVGIKSGVEQFKPKPLDVVINKDIDPNDIASIKQTAEEVKQAVKQEAEPKAETINEKVEPIIPESESTSVQTEPNIEGFSEVSQGVEQGNSTINNAYAPETENNVGDEIDANKTVSEVSDQPNVIEQVDEEPVAKGEITVSKVTPYENIESNQYKATEQLKFNQGNSYEPVRLVGEEGLIELISMGSRLKKQFRGGKPVHIDATRRQILEDKYGVNAIDAYDKARELAKANRNKNTENIVELKGFNENATQTKDVTPDEQTTPQPVEETTPAVEEQTEETNVPGVQSESAQGLETGKLGIPDVSSNDNGGIQPPPSATESTEPINSGRQFAIAKRIEEGNAPEAVKQGIKDKGNTYVPKGLNLTQEQADDLVDFYGEQKSSQLVRDLSNGITPDVRVAMTAKLYNQYVEQGRNEEAVDIALWQAQQSVEAGRASNAAKIWKQITGNEDNLAMAIEKEQQQAQQKVIEPIRNEVAQSRQDIDREIRKQVEAQVQATIEGRLARAKLFTEQDKQKVKDAFKKLKFNTKTQTFQSAVLPINIPFELWNTAMDIIEKAILTGADISNAIQAGIDHIRDNHKGDIDEDAVRKFVNESIGDVAPKPKIDRSKIKDKDIKTPKLSGNKKKEFIDEVVKAYNEGQLTDEKFDKLYAGKLGVREFSAEERQQIRDLSKTIATAEKFENELSKDFTRENIEKYKEFTDAARKANKQLQQFAQQPANVWDTLISIMQGNLLSSISLVANVFYNLAFQPLRFASTGIGSIADYSMSKLAKMGILSKSLEDRSIDMVALQKGYFPGGWNGAIEGTKQVTTGILPDERSLREISSSFSPERAVQRWKDKDRTTEQKINDSIEGTVGWSAEVMFRLLNMGDKPWRRAAETARAYELGTLKGLKGKDLDKFMLLPDQGAKEEIKKTGDEATFQQEGEVSKGMQRIVSSLIDMFAKTPLIGGPLKLVLKSQVPYVKTPLNLVIETLQYAAPPITAMVGIYQIVKGNKRAGSVLLGKAVVGGVIQAAAQMLFTQGMLTGDDDKEKKKRDFQNAGGTHPANSMNMSAMIRGDYKTKDGDIWVSYSKMGVLGVLFDNYANIAKDRVAEGEESDYMRDLVSSAPRVMSSTIEQSFLQGVSSLLEALKGDERTRDTWLIKTSEALGSIPYPNTIATTAKASDQYLRDLENESFWKRMGNTYKAKMFMGSDLPPKVNIWGDRVTGNPEGRNKIMYYLFDPSKFRDISTDNFRYQLYDKFKTDYSGDWLPAMPDRKFSYNGESRKLTPEEYELYSEYVGQARAHNVQALMNSSYWNQDDDEQKKGMLKLMYEDGLQIGKDQFVRNLGLNVKPGVNLPIDIKLLRYHLRQQKPRISP